MSDDQEPKPKRTGTVFRYAPPKPGEHMGHYVVRCSAPDGSRPLFHLDPSPESDEHRAAALVTAGEISADIWARNLGATPKRSSKREASTGDSFETWADNWIKERRKRGIASVRSDESRTRLHILPALGPLPVATITREDVERLVEVLDGKIQSGALSWKTATNIWTLVAKMFDDAAHSKTLALRVRQDNPCDGVRAPDKGARKAKTYLYPSEVIRFVECEDVPLRWRRLVAVAVYTFMRAGELEALDWSDIDVERGIVHVHRAADRAAGKGTKGTKTGHTRRFALEPAILPLLRAMHTEANGMGKVLRMPYPMNLARDLRYYLDKAHVDRAELTDSSATRKPLGFHDLRATGLTWMAVRGDDPLRIMSRAGHTTFATTQLYVREAEVLRDGFGEVFPELPASLADAGPGGAATSTVTSAATDELSTRNESAEGGSRIRRVVRICGKTDVLRMRLPPPRELSVRILIA